MKKFLCVLFAALMLVSLFAGCNNETVPQGDSDTDTNQGTDANQPDDENKGEDKQEEARQPDPDKKKIIYGITASFEHFTNYIPEMMAEWGYEVEIKMFDDPVIANTALTEGSVDANYIQHLPYLKAYNESNSTTLHACGPYIMSSMDAIGTKKYATLDEVPNGASIAVADDASNLSVNLEDLASIGWITLKEIPEGSLYTIFDIEENVKELELVEVSMFARFTALDDDVDLAMVFYSNTAQAKYNTTLLKLFDEEVVYPQVIAVRDEDKDSQWVADLIEAMTSETQVERINEKNDPALAWKILF